LAKQTIRARYANGVVTPLEPLELPEGCELEIAFTVRESGSGGMSVAAPVPASTSSRGLGAVWEIAERLHRKYPADIWDDVPTDFARNKKHYLYGHPKEEDE